MLVDTRKKKSVDFLFPVSYNDEKVYGVNLQRPITENSVPNESHVEMVALLSKGEVDSIKIRVESSLEDMYMSEFQDGEIYPQIKGHVLEHTELNSSLHISQIKRKMWAGSRQNYNLSKSEDSRQPQCPPEKEKAIQEALKYFGRI